MKLKRDRQPARVALIIFSTLIIFCVGQLTWWVVFHINSGEERRQLHLDALQDRAELITLMVNRDFDRVRKTAQMIFKSHLGNEPVLIEAFNQLFSDSALVGYQLLVGGDDQAVRAGTMDSTFYISRSDQIVLYLNAEYPQALLGKDNARLDFIVSGHHDGEESGWVKASMFVPSENWMAEINDKTRRTTVMFAAEGGFFFLIILFGAFMIYRTLYRAEELKFRQQNFIHSVTHELKAPLASIRLYLETIMAGKVDAARMEKLYPKMIEDCDRLEGLMDNVLEAGHFGKTGYKLKLNLTDLSDDLGQYLDDLEQMARRYGGNIARNIEAEIIIKSDYQSLRRLINSLVDNAFKYSLPDNRRIAVSLNKEGQYGVIRVSDKGIGIDSNEQGRVFERFYRGSDIDSRNAKGTGLGLFLVREIAEAHGGKVKVMSAGKGQGSEFIVSLPLEQL
ncbi:MAG: HAMP domain-containing histidine kinase [FCB group bacterium]|nr:HAMP domain-containing histidine kinase [FCB group bacterium]